MRNLVIPLVIIGCFNAWASAQVDYEGIVPDAEVSDNDQGSSAETANSMDLQTDLYIVQPGDTLWDISAQVLQNPWYWPKIWSYNPEISNPHWIYPGDQIRFFAPAEDLPSLADFASRKMNIPGEDQLEQDSNGDDLLIASDMEMPEETNEDSENSPSLAFIGFQKIGRAKPGSQHTLADVFVTPRQLTEAGVIANAAEEKILLTSFDKLYLKFPVGQEVGIGERFVLFRTTGEVVHPDTRKLYGHMTQITGIAKVTRLSSGYATAVVTTAYDVIERGQYVTPLVKDLYRQVSPRKNEKYINGIVLATRLQATSIIGENELVFIDKGKEDGVEVGNTFKVVYSGDPLTGPDPELPEESIADLLIVDVKGNASTALVTYALREVEVGNPVKMFVSNNDVQPE